MRTQQPFGLFQGYCGCCREWGHKRAECPLRAPWHAPPGLGVIHKDEEQSEPAFGQNMECGWTPRASVRPMSPASGADDGCDN